MIDFNNVFITVFGGKQWVEADIARELHKECVMLRHSRPQPTLTDEEREAVEWFAGLRPNRPLGARACLLAFLERAK